MRKIKLLRDLSRHLYDLDQDHFVGGCADLAWTIAQAAKEAGVPGVLDVYGYASGTLHAWLDVDGRVFDPRAFVEGIRYSNYERSSEVDADFFGVDTCLDYPEDRPYLLDEAVDFLLLEQRGRK